MKPLPRRTVANPKETDMNHTERPCAAAVRLAKVRGLLVECGLDGSGKPKYAAPVKVATHAASTRMQ
jgi:hypothetical protein